ncbi:MAG TPA: hypothetical protein VGO62_07390, partial [Myxococcota bacterium]
MPVLLGAAHDVDVPLADEQMHVGRRHVDAAALEALAVHRERGRERARQPQLDPHVGGEVLADADGGGKILGQRRHDA